MAYVSLKRIANGTKGSKVKVAALYQAVSKQRDELYKVLKNTDKIDDAWLFAAA